MAADEHPKNPNEEAELLKHLEDQIRRMSVADHLAYMMESLAALATRKLGLTAETTTERDLDQARLSIEAYRALLQVVEPERPMEEVNAYRSVLSQLQLAYVKAREIPAAGKPGGESEATSAESAEEAPADCDPPAGVTGEDEGLPEDGALFLED